jgi:hypothetical protein
VALSDVHQLWKKKRKGKDTRNETDLRSERRKHLVRSTFKEINCGNTTLGKGNKFLLGMLVDTDNSQTFTKNRIYKQK